ncbi:MAG: M23 family metallopeptidase [Thermoleophilaceae bacterium]
MRITPRVAGAVVALIPVLLLPSPALSSPGGGVEAPDAPGAQSAHDDGSAERAPAPSPSPRLGSGHRFPIRGPHNLGYGASNNFGGSRGHQGQDLFAACGTPVVAARGGEVRAAGYQSAAGNYAVVTGETTGIDYVYMHMLKAPRVQEGDQVRTG